MPPDIFPCICFRIRFSTATPAPGIYSDPQLNPGLSLVFRKITSYDKFPRSLLRQFSINCFNTRRFMSCSSFCVPVRNAVHETQAALLAVSGLPVQGFHLRAPAPMQAATPSQLISSSFANLRKVPVPARTLPSFAAPGREVPVPSMDRLYPDHSVIPQKNAGFPRNHWHRIGGKRT